MTITAKVIAHSRVDAHTPDLITLQLRYPRMIHAEFMTHRVFSRNASSSRAIPVERMIQDVIDDPAMPVRWGANQPGMQDAGDHDERINIRSKMAYSFDGRFSPNDAWLVARDRTVEIARGFAAAGYHKQVVNRLLEPFGHISVVCTATDWENFFDLRCHPDADPTMRALAEAMRDAIQASEPRILHSMEWHLPYVAPDDQWALHLELEVPQGKGLVHQPLAMISAARCARVSYLNHDGTSPDIAKDLALAERLLISKHMSPFEHQAAAFGVFKPNLRGNFTGWHWHQHRKMIEAGQQ
jgi:hypothetical protein